MSSIRDYWIEDDGTWHRVWFDSTDADCGLPVTDAHYAEHREQPPRKATLCSKCKEARKK